MTTYLLLWFNLAQFLEWEMFQTKVLEKIKTHILYSITFFLSKIVPLWHNAEKYGRARQDTWKYGARALHVG